MFNNQFSMLKINAQSADVCGRHPEAAVGTGADTCPDADDIRVSMLTFIVSTQMSSGFA